MVPWAGAMMTAPAAPCGWRSWCGPETRVTGYIGPGLRSLLPPWEQQGGGERDLQDRLSQGGSGEGHSTFQISNLHS